MGPSAFTFKHQFSKPNKRRYKRALMHITLPFDAFFLQNQREYPHKLYTARNCSPCRWLVLLIVWLYLHQFSCYHFVTVARLNAYKLLRKQNLLRNRHSESLKVMHFDISEKPSRDCVSLCCSTRLICTAHEDIARENAKNWYGQQQHCCLTPSLQETSVNVGKTLILPETIVIGLQGGSK